MIFRLNPAIQVIVKSKDNREGRALGWIDYSDDHDLLWIIAMYDTGEVWIIPNPEIRVHENWTLGR